MAEYTPDQLRVLADAAPATVAAIGALRDENARLRAGAQAVVDLVPLQWDDEGNKPYSSLTSQRSGVR